MSTTRQVTLDRQQDAMPSHDIPAGDTPTRMTHEEPTFDRIAEEAYAIYLSNGGQDGRDLDDWLEAERRIAARHHQ